MEIIPPHILLGAYAEGVFPMADEGELIWFSPEMRGIVPVDERFHVSSSLKKTIRKVDFEVLRNTAFKEVMYACASREETWIDECIVASYSRLYDLGYAHSFEVWDEDGLQGGLYGVSFGKAFFGESMFSRKRDTSKIALVSLVDWMRSAEMTLLDTQWMTDHLKQFGGIEVPREEYLELLSEALSDVISDA